MHTTLNRNAPADQFVPQLHHARCCDALAPCPNHRAELHEIRAARRDAVIHSLSTMRARR